MSFKDEWEAIKTEYHSGDWITNKAKLKDRLKSKPVILYGVGFFGAVIVKNFADEGINVVCFCDSNKHGTDSETGLKIISPQELKDFYSDANIVISVANPTTEKIVHNVISSLGFAEEQIFSFKDAYKFMHTSRVEPVSMSIDDFEKHLDGFERVYNMITDHISRKIIIQVITNYLFNKTFEYDAPENSYFPEQFTFNNHEVFVDAGLYTGDTSLDFIRRLNGEYSHIIGFDIDENNLSSAYKNLSAYPNVHIVPKGLWNCSLTANAELGLTAGSNIKETGADIVDLVGLDDYFAGSFPEIQPTFIKMDIEGSEKEALIGSERIIKTYKPKLAICVYHKPEDIYEIPELIKSFNPNYKLFLRHYSPYVWDTVLYAY